MSLILGFLLLLALGGAAAVIQLDGERLADQAVAGGLSGSQSAYSTIESHRRGQLRLIAQILRTDPILIAYLADSELEDAAVQGIADSLEEYGELLSFGLTVVFDRNRRVLYRSDDRTAEADDRLPENSLVSAAFAVGEASGVWQYRGRLYEVVAVRLVQQFDLVGCVVVGLAIDDSLALQVRRSGGAEVAFLASSPTFAVAAASPTFDPDLRAALLPELRQHGDLLERVMKPDRENAVKKGGEPVPEIDLDLGGEAWTASLVPLQDADGVAVGAVVALASRARYLAGTRQTLIVLGGLGLIALVAGVLFSNLLAWRVLRPVGRLALAAEQAAQGDPQAALPAAGSGKVGRLADALAALLRTQREKLALENVLGRVARLLPEPARSRPVAGPRSAAMALVGIEMRRFASPKISYDPEENLGRYTRDLKRIANAAASRKGRIESVSGHRVLVVFDGDGYAPRALAAATEILVHLGERENVFDEPAPPVVAATHGNVIAGTVAGGDQAATAVAGLPVQQLESLMREAVPGEIYLSKQLAAELDDTFRSAGVELRPQRGFLSPQPFFILSAEVAGRISGVSPAPPSAAGFPNERRSLSDLEPGLLLGHRFELLAELGAGRMGVVFKARDRELGDVVTLKMLKPEVVADARQFEWLRGVIQRARMIRHPNVLAIFDFGEADGLPYVSTEFARGMSLRFVLDQGRQLPWLAVLGLARQLCRGLDAIHGERVLHRGVQPDNVLLEVNGQARLMDVGLTVPVSAGGTPGNLAYLAPEELAGQAATDPRGDVYALGAVLYEALAGQVPVPGATADELRHRHTAEEPSPLSALCELPGELERIVLRCLAKAPEGRYGTAAEILEVLESVPA